MDTIVRIAGSDIDLLPFAAQAIRLFGGVRIDHAVWLAGVTARHLDEGHLGRAIMKSDAAAVANALTKRGAAEPLRTLDRLAIRTARWAYGESTRRRMAGLEGGRSFRSALFSCTDSMPRCAEASALLGIRFPLASAPLVPLPCCRAEPCRCRLVPSREPPNCKVRRPDGASEATVVRLAEE
jgi:hypothetical protein